MYSFYGGRPGNSFIIVAAYATVAEMINNFKQGASYTAVHYDEHVIINTINKNDPDNGKIYRRGYDFNNDMGGAEYIGSIVGPSGNAPMLELTTITDVDSQSAGENYAERRNSGSYTVANGSLVPGKTSSGGYNDAITWKSCSVRDANHEDTVAYIGFKIPYTVIDYEAVSVEPYNNGVYADRVSTTRLDTGSHPFYEKWRINIPKGVQGDALKNFRIITPQAGDQILDMYNGGAYTGISDDINNERQILVYDQYKYDTNQNGSPQTIYLGDYNTIKDVTVANDGTLTIYYTHDDAKTITKKIKWINNITTTDGNLTVSYNNGTTATTFAKALKSVSNVRIGDNGTLTFDYNTKNQDGTTESISFNNVLRWIDSVSLNQDGTIQIQYNNESAPVVINEDNALRWIQDLYINNDGHVMALYNGETSAEYVKIGPPNGDGSEQQDIIIKWITSISLSENGIMTINYNDGSSRDLTGTPVRWINSITEDQGILRVQYNTLDNEGNYLYDTFDIDTPTNIDFDDSSQEIKVTWKSGDTQAISPPINYILDTAVDSLGRFLIKFSAQDGGVTWNNQSGWTYIGTIGLQGLIFNADQSIIQNKLLLGYIDNNGALSFDLNTTQLLPNRINSITISECDIEVLNKANNSNIVTIDATATCQITNNLFGLNFNFSNLGLSNRDTSVIIHIKNMTLSFTFDEFSEETTEIQWERRLNELEQKALIVDGNISNLSGSLQNNTQSINTINNKIGTTALNNNNTGGTTITNSLKALKTQVDKIGTTTLNNNNTGGTDITSSLAALKKPSYNVPSASFANQTSSGNLVYHFTGKGTDGQTMLANQSITLTGENSILNQQHGYVLQFSSYNKSAASGDQFHPWFCYYYFVPKDAFRTDTADMNQKSLTIPIFSANYFCVKILYFYHTRSTNTTEIKGNNQNGQQVTVGGIQFNNDKWVLSGIYGV